MRQGDARNIVGKGAVLGAAVQANTVGDVTINVGPPGANPPDGADEWVELAFESSVWQHASADIERFRQHVCTLVAKLAALRDEAEQQLAGDPWQDPDVVRRFTERIEWLLGEPGSDPLDLYPAEAALFVLTPFLYRVHHLRLASRFAEVGPAELGERAEDRTPLRKSFEEFADGHELLSGRAQQADSKALIGWWLFHRWLAQREEFADPDQVDELLDLVGPPAAELRGVLNSKRVSRLLHGLWRGPDVGNPEYLEELPADDRVGPQQRIRYRRLALLTCLAYNASVEMTSLPSIIAEHLGIPYPVKLEELLSTLEHADWSGSPDIPVLRANCHHEAVIEAVREYVMRVDELLHAVRRTADERITHPMPQLPSRLSANEVVPVGDVFTGWAKFRLNERRIRDLLMGVQLYKDRDLAVRELYQNALDACRYRRARTQYLDRTGPASYGYDGKITFVQGVDEDGREYLDCIDNGIGMGESELRGVFSNAGARFAEQPEFLLEQAKWNRLDPPVKLYPNSRFGIGVMSYFMLADEIRVTTCRMGLDGHPGPELEVSIFGPGHLFRIVQRAERGPGIGTKVRLYLRPDKERPANWSCMEVIERLLGIAEFPITVQHDQQRNEWAAGELKSRLKNPNETFGLDVREIKIPWTGAPNGVQVFWCEGGGGLLVDGLVVEPAVRRGVLSSRPTLKGVVVNLFGEFAPNRLSADRTEVLDDISDQIRTLLESAATDLVNKGAALPTFKWICNVAEANGQLADVITSAAVENQVRLESPHLTFDTSMTGCFPADTEILAQYSHRIPQNRKIRGTIPDHILLWRLLAHRSAEPLAMLTEICPEIGHIREVRPATPSHLILLCRDSNQGVWSFALDFELRSEEHLSRVSSGLGITKHEAATTLTELGFDRIHPDNFPESDVHSKIPDDTHIGRTTSRHMTGSATKDPLLQRNLNSFNTLRPGEPVPLGHIAQASLKLDLPVSEVRSRLSGHGLDTDPGWLPERPQNWMPVLLSTHLDGNWPWLHWSAPVPPGHVLAAAQQLDLEPTDTLVALAELGLKPPETFPDDAHFDDLPLLRSPRSQSFLLCPGPTYYSDLFLVAENLQRPLRAVLARLRAYGFDFPLLLPEEPQLLDGALLQPIGLWLGVGSHTVMPFAHVVLATHSLNASPRDVTAHLARYGVKTSRKELPEGLPLETARKLLSRYSYGSPVLRGMLPVKFKDLLDTSLQMRIPITEVAHWYRELGLNVPDVAETIRNALAHVPRSKK
ncbi:wHTH domain-containing protein [Saccharopolyspora sp. NPDC002376]